VALNGNLHLELPVLDLFHQALRQLPVDALADHRLLPHRLAGGLLERLVVDDPHVDLAAGEMPLQQFVHLLELQLIVGIDGDLGAVPLDPGLRVFEIIALAHLARHVGERIVDLLEVGFRDDVERRHRKAPPLPLVMPGLDPELQSNRRRAGFSWIAGLSPAMTQISAYPRNGRSARRALRPDHIELGGRISSLLEPYPLGIALLELLDLLEILASLVELAPG